ncbi:MAG: ABC transporter substrate-binding protein [Actinomycetota bacterium]
MDSSLKSVTLAATLVATLLGCTSHPASQAPNNQTPLHQTPTKFVAITQIVEHPALDATRDGVKAELAAAGFTEGKNLKLEWQSAQGSPTTATQIANKFVGDKPDVIVAIATPSAQAVVAIARNIPIIFTAVTDPLGAKLVTNLDKPGGTVTGVSALTPIDKHLDLIAKITPKAKRIGVLYNAGEANSLTLLKLLKQEAPKRGMTLVEATVARSSDVATAARSLVGKADAIYIPTDNTVVSALESVIQVGIENKLPIYAGDSDSVKRGALAALGYNYYEVGRQTGKIVLQVLNGEKPGNIPVESAKKNEFYLNLKSAQKMGVSISETVKAEADRVIQ